MFNGDIFHDPWLITLVHPQSHGIALFLEVTMGIVVKASERWQAAQAPIFGFWICLPSGNGWHSYRKWPIYSWFTYKKWWFSIAMFVYQRVRENWKRKPSTFHGQIHGFLFRFSLKPIEWWSQFGVLLSGNHRQMIHSTKQAVKDVISIWNSNYMYM